jgi:hypothetical protein
MTGKASMSEMGQAEKWRRIRRESVRPHTTDIERVMHKTLHPYFAGTYAVHIICAKWRAIWRFQSVSHDRNCACLVRGGDRAVALLWILQVPASAASLRFRNSAGYRKQV